MGRTPTHGRDDLAERRMGYPAGPSAPRRIGTGDGQARIVGRPPMVLPQVRARSGGWLESRLDSLSMWTWATIAGLLWIVLPVWGVIANWLRTGSGG